MRKRFPVEPNPLLRPGVFVWLAALVVLGFRTIFSPFIAMFLFTVLTVVYFFGYVKHKPRGR